LSARNEKVAADKRRLILDAAVRVFARRGHDRSEDCRDEHADDARPQLVGAQAFQPQEGGKQDAEQRAVEVRALGTTLDDGDGVERPERDGRRKR
jgi:hypothetical protein